jgi:threonine/homoserine efflux transporter RhtA
MHPADQLLLNFAGMVGVATLTVIIGGAILSRLTRPRKEP